MSFPHGNWINRVFLFIAYHWFSMMPLQRESKAVSRILRQLYWKDPEGWVRMVYDVNFIFRPFKRRHTLHDSTLKVQRLWINEQLNHRIPNSTGVTNNATNTPWQLWRWTGHGKGPVSGRRVAIKGALADFSGVRAPREPAWCWGVQLSCGQITAHIIYVSYLPV